MKIYTSSWSTKLPAEIQKIGISRGTPRRYPAGYRRMPELAPGPWFNSVTPAEYHRRFMAQLGALDARAVLQKLHDLGAGRDMALLCYEAPHDPKAWCHRGQVSGWLKDELDLDVFEFSTTWPVILCRLSAEIPKLTTGRGKPSSIFTSAFASFGLERAGCGWRHPKLLPQFQRGGETA
jgi:hypothetical protein